MSTSRTKPSSGWEITDHICRVCLGRVLSKVVDGNREFRCSNCGVTGTGVVRSICCCGMKVPGLSKADKRDAGIRCQPNPNPTPEIPAEIIAAEVA